METSIWRRPCYPETCYGPVEKLPTAGYEDMVAARLHPDAPAGVPRRAHRLCRDWYYHDHLGHGIRPAGYTRQPPRFRVRRTDRVACRCDSLRLRHNFSLPSTLAIGVHSIHGRVTDSGGLTGSFSMDVTVTPLAPDVPTGLIASAVSTTSVTLTWNSSAGATYYIVERTVKPKGTAAPYWQAAQRYTVLATASPQFYTMNETLAAGTYVYRVPRGNRSGPHFRVLRLVQRLVRQRGQWRQRKVGKRQITEPTTCVSRRLVVWGPAWRLPFSPLLAEPNWVTGPDTALK